MIRKGGVNEVEKFQLYHEDNQGSEIVVCEREGEVVGFAQFDEGYSDAAIHFFEAEESRKGIGSEIVEWFKKNYHHVETTNTNPNCAKWLSNRGFTTLRKNRDGSSVMEWADDE